MRSVATYTVLRRVAWIVPVLLFVPLAWAGDNLLANPGFEKLSVDQPVRWNLFVQPQEGAFGRIDDTAHNGKYAVQLHIPTPYPRDPANNWSQNILGEFGGQRLRLSGYLKTADATEAALWLQCWRKRPWGVLYCATTSTDTPVYGDRDWEFVSLEFTVPEKTDFLILRCVLKGVGAAWFDDLQLAVVEEDTSDGDMKTVATQKDEKEEKEAQAKKEKEKEVEENALSPASTETASETASPSSPVSDEAPEIDLLNTGIFAPAQEEATTALASIEVMDSEMGDLRATNHMLAEAVQQMQDANAELREEIFLLRGELQALQLQLTTVREISESPELSSAPSSSDPAPNTKTCQAPPLVPHGVDWRKALACNSHE